MLLGLLARMVWLVQLVPQALLGQPEQLVLTVLLASPDPWVQQALPAQMA